MLTVKVDSAAFERLIKNRIKIMPEIGRAAVDQVAQMHRKQVQKGFKGYSGDPNTGRKLQNRSGALMQRLAVRPSATYPTDIRADSYVAGPLAYAKIQEFGGVIKPKKGKYLTIPLPGARTSNGVTRNSARLVKRGREWHTAQTVPGAAGTKTHIRGKAIGVDGVGGDFLPLYALKKSVKIPARLRFMDTFKDQKAKRRKVYRRVVKAFAEGRRF